MGGGLVLNEKFALYLREMFWSGDLHLRFAKNDT